MNTITLSKNYSLREHNGYVELHDDNGAFIRTLNSFEEEFVKAAYAEGRRSMVDYRAIIERTGDKMPDTIGPLPLRRDGE